MLYVIQHCLYFVDKCVTYMYVDSTWKDLLTKYGNQTITYDAQGNPTSYLGHTLTWEMSSEISINFPVRGLYHFAG